jgi:hypothetical protein
MRTKQLLVLSLILLIFASCGVGHKTIKKPYDWIPTDFDYAHTTLLVEAHPYSKAMNRKLKKVFNKKYKWNFIVTTQDSIINKRGAYSNTQLYPYALLWSDSRSAANTVFNTETVGSSAGYYSMDAHFYNRKIDSAYRNAQNTKAYAAQTHKVVANTLKKRWK